MHVLNYIYLHAQAKCCKGKLIFKRKVQVCSRELMTRAFTIRLADAIRPKACARTLFIIHVSYWPNIQCANIHVFILGPSPNLHTNSLGKAGRGKIKCYVCNDYDTGGAKDEEKVEIFLQEGEAYFDCDCARHANRTVLF